MYLRSKCMYLLTFALLFAFAMTGQAAMVWDQVNFQDATYITSGGPQNEGGEADNGGAIFIFVRCTADSEGFFQDLGNRIKIDGTYLNSTSGYKWARAYPKSIQNGQTTVITIKGVSSPISEGHNAHFEIWADDGTKLDFWSTLNSTPVKVGNVVPSRDNTKLYIFLRNDDSVSHTITNAYVMGQDVWNKITYVGGSTIAPGDAKVAIVDWASEWQMGEGSAIPIRFFTSSGMKIGAFTRWVSPEFKLGTWSGDIFDTDARMIEAKKFSHDCAGPAATWDYDYRSIRYGVGGMPMPDTEPPITADPVIEWRGNPTVYGWFVDDEPELSGRTSQNTYLSVMTCWDNDNRRPTMLNLARAREFQQYLLTVDHPCYDHYCQYAPLVYGGSGTTYSMKNSWRYANCLKENCEPLRLWAYAQGVSTTTGWRGQPTAWGIRVQVWNQLVAGIKGLKWFFAKDESGYTTQYNAIRDVLKEVNQVKGLVLYSEAVDRVTESHSDMIGGMLVGENQCLAVVTNSSGWHTWNLFSSSVGMNDLNSQSITVNVPSHINIQQVKRVTPSGLTTASYSQNGQQLTFSGLNLTSSDAYRVYLIGANDTTAPEAPKDLQLASWQGSTAVLTWDQAYDNIGVKGYKVYRNDSEIADVRVPIYEDTSGSATATYKVKAYDAAGNFSVDSTLLKLSQPTWNFNQTGNFEGWGEHWSVNQPYVRGGSFIYWTKASGQPNLMSGEVAIDTSQMKRIRIHYYNQTASATQASIYWDDDPTGASLNAAEWFSITPANQWNYADIDLSGNANWTGTVRCLRLDLPGYGQADWEYMAIDSIEVLPATLSAPTVTNASGATNVTHNSARLNGQVTDTGGDAPTCTIYWGDNNGGTTPGNWDNNVGMGTQSGSFYTDVSGLAASTTYYYRCYAVNSQGSDWADSSASFVTTSGVVAPTVTNASGASNVTQTTARLNGQVTSTGGETPNVTIYWGDNDGGTGTWDNSINKGLQSGSFYSDISSLSPSTTYYYRCYASNSGGSDWADSTANFTTQSAVSAPTVTNASGASNIGTSSARLNGEVTSTGGENPTVIVYWGNNDGGTNPGSWDSNANKGTQSGSFYHDVSGLSSDTTYYYRCYASNSGGSDWANSTSSFKTDKSGCASDAMIRENMLADVSATSSFFHALLPLIPAGLALGIYGVTRRRRK